MDTRVAPASAAKPGELALMLRMIREYLGPRKFTLFLAVVCMAGGAATTAALAWLLDPAIKLIFLDKRGDMLLLIPVAIVLWILTGVWVAYRVIRGWITLARNRPI